MARILVVLILTFIWSTISLSAKELNDWPLDLTIPSGTITIYQPQVDLLQGDILTARAAVAYKAGKNGDPVFGAAWFEGQVEIDRGDRTVKYRTLEVTEVRFPEGSETAGQEFVQAVKEGMIYWDLASSMEDLTTSLVAAGKKQQIAAILKNAPPVIIYRKHPALLVSIDGKEQVQPIVNTIYHGVINTPYPLIRDTFNNSWHLNAAQEVWYKAQYVDGPWMFDPNPPADMAAFVQQQKTEQDLLSDQQEKINADNAPEIIIVHQPSELVVSQGKAEFKPLVGDLLVMSNTDSSVFMDVAGQLYYLVVSGRWYRSKSMEGKWSYIQSDQLPPSFADIPADSDYGDIRVYVADTDEAQEAVMDAQIPQTAALKRGIIDIKIFYDGNPKFQKVDGTDLQFAVNASETVIKDNRSFYLVKDGVWYRSSSPDGPWQVSDHAPPGIDDTQPSSPVYNTKYVYVYDSTPDVVYVGYTPGYLCSYVYGPTIVFGTGWHYRPWITPRYYYPRHTTWGFNVNYNQWGGWGFGLSWNYGPFHYGWHSGGGWHRHPWYRQGWWGPGGYRPGIHNMRMSHVNKRKRIKVDHPVYKRNLYRRKNQSAVVQKTTDIRKMNPSILRAKTANPKHVSYPNNVYTDKAGNIYRKEKGHWQKRTGNQWYNVNTLPMYRLGQRSAVSPSRPMNKLQAKPQTLLKSKPVQMPLQRQVGTPMQNRPAINQSTTSYGHPAAIRKPSAYSRGTSIERYSHARKRAGGQKRRY